MCWNRFLFIALTVFLSSCGGGGSGTTQFVGAAEVNVNTTPHELDAGDRTLVEIEVRNSHPDGIALKIKYPIGLEYVEATSFVEVEGQVIDIDPGTEVVIEDATYLVYYLPQSVFGNDNFGKVFFQLVARSAVDDGSIEVDPDADYTKTFDPNVPDFFADDDTSFTVVD